MRGTESGSATEAAAGGEASAGDAAASFELYIRMLREAVTDGRGCRRGCRWRRRRVGLGVGGYSTTEVGVEVEAGEVEQNKKMISVLTPDCD